MDNNEFYQSLPVDLSGSRSKNRFRLELLWGLGKLIDLMDTADDFTVVFDYVSKYTFLTDLNSIS